MRQEKSAGVVLFYYNAEKKQPYFLLLKYPSYWGFAKGSIEEKESEETAAKREVKEETGIVVSNLIPGFREEQTWFFKAEGKTVKKHATYFLAEIKKEDLNVKLSSEHEGFVFVDLEESKKYVKIKQNRELLKKAFEFVKENKKQMKIFS